MKKNIEIVNVNKKLLSLINDSLKNAPRQIEGQKELISELDSLIKEETSSLLITIDGEGLTSFKPNQIEYKGLTINPISRKVIRDGQEISLTPKEFDILYFLASNKGQVFTKEQIYRAVWEDEYLLDDSNIMAFIRKLRKKIELNPDDPIYIITIWGIGYKFNDN